MGKYLGAAIALLLSASLGHAQPLTTKPSLIDMLAANCPPPRAIIGGAAQPGCSNVALTDPASLATLTLLAGKTLTVNNTVTFTATDGSTVAFGGGGTALFLNGPIGTPSSGVATNLTGTASGLTAGNVTTNANMAGDVSSVGNATTIGAHKVLRSMEAQGVARSVVGVTSNATADVADIQGTASQWFGVNAAGTGLSFQTLGGDCSGAIPSIVCTKTNGTSFATVATSGSASDLGTGTLPAGRMPAFTGDVTTSAGAVATTIAANAVTNAKAAQMAANTIKGNNTGGTANAADLTVAQLAAMLTAPTRCVIILTSAATCNNGGSAANNGTYTTPANTKYLVVRLEGAGGGGGGGGTGAPTNGAAGGNTTFDGSTYTASGGGAGLATGLGTTNGGAGGSASGGSVNAPGGSADPQASGTVTWGTRGGSSGCGGQGGSAGTAAVGAGAGATNSGGGGGGGGSAGGVATNGTGGGGGGCVLALIASPSASYTYAVGPAGSAGSAGTSGNGGNSGATGRLIVDAYSQ